MNLYNSVLITFCIVTATLAFDKYVPKLMADLLAVALKPLIG